MNRNLLFVAIGAFGLTAQFIGGLFAGESWAPKSRLRRVPVWILCLALLFIHVVVAGANRIVVPQKVSFVFETFYSTVELGSPPDVENKTVVVVNAPHPFLFLGLPVLRAHENKALPERTRVLAPGFVPLEIARTADKTLLLKARTGNIMSPDPFRTDVEPNFVYFYHEFNTLFRPENLPFKVGEQVELTGMSVKVLSVDEKGLPTQVQFDFAVSLDDPSLHWLQWNWKKSGFGSYSTFIPPAVGEKCDLSGPFGDN